MFCKHEWKILSETATKSELELAVELGATRLKNVRADRKCIQIVFCDKCGKLKRFVEQI